jgi:hypothetical protein
MSPGVGTGTISLRFGLRSSSSQPPGRYVAPLLFEVLAPNS